jgi:hypothetical protein
MSPSFVGKFLINLPSFVNFTKAARGDFLVESVASPRMPNDVGKIVFAFFTLFNIMLLYRRHALKFFL